MFAKDIYSAAAYIASITQIAQTMGIQLKIGSDFNRFKDIPNQQAERGHVAPLFDPAYSRLSPTESFWVIGMDNNGDIVHAQAVKLLDLSGITLEQYLQENLGDFRPFGNKVDPQKSTTNLTSASARISGKICYYGELWLKGGKKGYRGHCLTAVLPRLAFALGLLQWGPDFIIGIMEPLSAFKGLAAREGYAHLEQGSIFWHVPNTSAQLEGWLFWMSREDLMHLMRVPPGKIKQWYDEAAQIK